MLGMRGESERLGLASGVVVKRLLRQSIKSSRANILLDLAIPDRPVELEEPGSKLRKLFLGKRPNLLLDLLDLAHDLPRCVQSNSTIGVRS